MTDLLSKILLITTSFVPLFILTLVRLLFVMDFGSITAWNINGYEILLQVVLFCFLIIAIALGVISLMYYPLSSRAIANTEPCKLTKAEDITDTGLDFFVTFIIPLVMVEFNTAYILVFWIIMVFLYGFMASTSKYYSNAILSMFGYKTYNVDCGKGPSYVITKQKLGVGNNIAIKQITKEVSFAYRVD